MNPATRNLQQRWPWQIVALAVFLGMFAIMHAAAALMFTPWFLLSIALEVLLIYGVWKFSRAAWVVLAIIGGAQAAGLIYIMLEGSYGAGAGLVVQLVFLAVLLSAYPIFFQQRTRPAEAGG